MDANQMLQGRYLNAADLRGRRSVRVTISAARTVTFKDGSAKLVLSFEGARKGLALNRTNLRAVIRALATSETDRWVGQAITLQLQTAQFGGQDVDAVRVAAPPEPPPPSAPPSATAGPRPGAPETAPFVATDEDVPF